MVAPASTLAWNAAGHRLVAAIAWQELAVEERVAVAALLAAHPDAERWQRKVAPGDDPALVRFTEASTWADDIRRDARFHDSGREPETPLLEGFPDMARHREWHYLNLPVGAPSRHGAPAGEIDRRIGRLAESLADPRAAAGDRAYALVWLIHLVGDIHQPLHVATRHDAAGDDDGGGNGIAVVDPGNSRHPESNLHAWWDDLPGPPWLRGARLLAAAERLRREHAPPGAGEALDVGLWRDESHRLAATVVYPHSTASPLVLDPNYQQLARRVAGERLLLAGHRLARLLRAMSSGGAWR